ncbi:hypothetical protein OY14_00535 [Borreliella chilensis]|uniref:Uncharacterized protein n=1 Tax=Borreliella chilensis TaxID=1245910 RepID=A0A0A7UV35_9SPIR|nr:hypothetical protein OY14_00535 [Borreliella chilensis]
MHFKKILLIIFIISTLNAYSYNHAIQYKNEGVDKYYFEILNDGFGFSLSDFFDDLRSGSLIFTYASKYNFIINLEAHMLTYRGYKDSLESLISRADLIEIGFMYYFPILLLINGKNFGEIDLGIGIKNLLFGNWGGYLTQKLIHLLLNQHRPIPSRKSYDSYNYRGFLSFALNYSFMNFLNLENYIELSYLADYFIKNSIGITLKNENIGFDLKLYAQTQNQIESLKTYSKIQEAETGIGINYRLYSKNFFITNNLNIKNFSPKENFLSVGGFGIIITPGKYIEMPKSKNELNIISNNFYFGFDIMIPFKIRNSIFYKINENLKYYFSISTNYYTNYNETNSFTNRLSSGIMYELFPQKTFNPYIISGLFFAYNQNNQDIKNIFRPIRIKNVFQTGIENELGLLFEMLKYHNTKYIFKIYSKVNYVPLAYNLDKKQLEKHSINFNYLGIGIVIK